MTDREWHELEETIEAMTPVEKASLIERVTRSMRGRNGRNTGSRPDRVAQRLAELASLPLQSPDDGFRGADHDALLYGRSSRSNSPDDRNPCP